MPPRVLIRHKDLRQHTPNTPARAFSEEDSLRGRYFEADCIATDTVGDFVYITGAPVGGFFQVKKVDITDAGHLPTAGVIVEKTTTTRCFVVRFGLIDVSSFPSAPTLTPQSKYWIGFDGRLRDSLPTPVSGTAVAQLVGHALSTTELLLLEGTQPIKLRA